MSCTLNTWLQWIGQDKCKMRRESFKFWDLVRLILQVLRYDDLLRYEVSYLEGSGTLAVTEPAYLLLRHFEGLVQERSNSIANALTHRFCTGKSSISSQNVSASCLKWECVTASKSEMISPWNNFETFLLKFSPRNPFYPFTNTD